MKTINIKGKEHPTYEGVLEEAHKNGLVSIEVEVYQVPNEANHFLAVCTATATFRPTYNPDDELVFTEVGDASPENVNSMIAPHILRMAATRAKGRALRDALGIGKALREEMGD